MSGKELDAAKEEVAACEKEIAIIKAKLRSLGSSSSSDESPPNSLQVQWNKVEGLPDTAQPKLTLQLSSPIEEKNLDAVNSSVSFRGVETGQATLTVSALDADIPLGSSKAYDVAVFTIQLLDDPIQPAASYEHELVVPITAVNDDTAVCTVHLKTKYSPSQKDQKEELYELLNKTTQAKSAAVEKLRSASMAVARSTATTSASSTKSTGSNPAVKAGFLNKNKSANNNNKPSKWKVWYQTAVAIAPVAKNYVLFAVFIGLSHFHGQKLAIPAPV